LSRLSKAEVAEIVSQIFETSAASSGGNWIQMRAPATDISVYFSQCKSSNDSKGNWNYLFFHTLNFEIIQEVAANSGLLVLLNYVERKYVILNGADLVWIAHLSCRKKSNQGVVCDIVIDCDSSGSAKLRPYDRFRTERRSVEVKSCP
jgi:hypothetical protein